MRSISRCPSLLFQHSLDVPNIVSRFLPNLFSLREIDKNESTTAIETNDLPVTLPSRAASRQLSHQRHSIHQG